MNLYESQNITSCSTFNTCLNLNRKVYHSTSATYIYASIQIIEIRILTIKVISIFVIIYDYALGTLLSLILMIQAGSALVRKQTQQKRENENNCYCMLVYMCGFFLIFLSSSHSQYRSTLSLDNCTEIRPVFLSRCICLPSSVFR